MTQQTPKNILLLADYWHGLAAGDTPERSQFHIEQVRNLMPYLMLVDFETAPFRVRYRLSGTRVDEVTGLNLTGRYLDEFLDGDYAGAVRTMLDYYEEASRTGQPRIWFYPWAGENPKDRQIAVGIFPLKVDGVISQCVAIEDYGLLNVLEDGRVEPADRKLHADWARLQRR